MSQRPPARPCELSTAPLAPQGPYLHEDHCFQRVAFTHQHAKLTCPCMPLAACNWLRIQQYSVRRLCSRLPLVLRRCVAAMSTCSCCRSANALKPGRAEASGVMMTFNEGGRGKITWGTCCTCLATSTSGEPSVLCCQYHSVLAFHQTLIDNVRSSDQQGHCQCRGSPVVPLCDHAGMVGGRTL